MAMDYDVFISYRREGGAQYARILKAELEKRGYRVFLDYDELNDGRFDSTIMQAIESAPIFIFILTPGALDRCVNEDDWVRREIEYAMETERNIIPVNFDGLFRAFPESLPEEVRNIIGQHQFSKIDSESLLQESIDKLVRNRIAPFVKPKFVKSSKRLLESVSKILQFSGGILFPSPFNKLKDSVDNLARERTIPSTTSSGAEIFIQTDAECVVLCFDKQLVVASPGKKNKIHLTKGNHLLEFVSTENTEVRKQQRYTVPDNDYTDFIEVKLLDKLNEN